MDTRVTTEIAPGLRHILITVSFLLGIIGNLTALWILYKSRNSKHVLMLRCLVTNDLVAEVGMMILMYLQIYHVFPLYWNCVLYVCFRAFGLASGCVAFVMAVERWFALTRPFLYQQVITYEVIKRTIFILWFLAAIITYLPLFGFGLYYKDEKCCRYRDATEYKDIIYAYLFLAFGTTLCVFILICNTSVFCALAGTSKKRKKVLVRRVSRSIINRIDTKRPIITSEELAFAKLMAILCIIFVVCWSPQMILIPLAQFLPDSKTYKVMAKMADMLMCIYLTLDPYVYVLHQYLEKGKFKLPFTRRSTPNITQQNSNGTPTSILLQPPNIPITTQ